MAVLTFALVAAYIPIKPASEEHAAPTITAIAEYIPSPSHTKPTRITMKMSKYLYSVFMNARAPEWI